MDIQKTIYCLKVIADKEVCEECELYSICDHELQGDMARTVISAMQELQQYRQIGTVEECREARQKQEAMTVEEIGEDYFVCPSCKMFITSLSDFDDHKYCLGCGQALKFTEREENEYEYRSEEL